MHLSTTCKSKITLRNRTITKVVSYFLDDVMHHLIVNAIKPIIEKGMYKYSCGSIPNRGGHYAQNYLSNAVQTDPKNTRYVLYFDIKNSLTVCPQYLAVKLIENKVAHPHNYVLYY